MRALTVPARLPPPCCAKRAAGAARLPRARPQANSVRKRLPLCHPPDVVGGMNLARLNLAHGTHEYHRSVVERIRRLNKEKGFSVAIMVGWPCSQLHIATHSTKCGATSWRVRSCQIPCLNPGHGVHARRPPGHARAAAASTCLHAAWPAC